MAGIWHAYGGACHETGYCRIDRSGDGFAGVRADGARRVYSIEAGPLREVDAWMSQFRGFWEHKLDALSTEIARGKRNRRR